ncbi:hypothetical protein HLB42_20325 (plasmid) [Deinococcus sp. D7000]|nr:hypothetical protein HLB42_20325 [Deinococcus sp. D7000]
MKDNFILRAISRGFIFLALFISYEVIFIGPIDSAKWFSRLFVSILFGLAFEYFINNKSRKDKE